MANVTAVYIKILVKKKNQCNKCHTGNIRCMHTQASSKLEVYQGLS